MLFKVFDVSHGASYFMKTNTDRTELIDLGCQSTWSPVEHVYKHYVPRGGTLDRLVLTHHHGDHVEDIDTVTPARKPKTVLRRQLTGQYETACRNSNSSQGQRNAEKFDKKFKDTASSTATWNVTRKHWCLTVSEADAISSTWGELVNCCSYVVLYNHEGTKILQCGDMEKDGMKKLLDNNKDMRNAVKGVDILIAPHHGHKSGFSQALMDAMGRPDMVVASVMKKDAHVDSRYSSNDFVRGVRMNDGSTRRLFTTRDDGAITIESKGNGNFSVRCNQR